MSAIRTDDIFDDDLSRQWIKAIGEFGDPIRMFLVNPVVAFVSNNLVAEPLTSNIVGPRNLIQRGLQNACRDFAKFASDDLQLQNWHADAKCLAMLYPALKRATLWDLGCGEGYLGRWIASQGATYVGVEPSKALFEYAKKMKKATKESLFGCSIDEFLAKMRVSNCGKPTLISLIAVLDGCKNPIQTIRAINEFLRDKGWTDVPLLLTTFDPDFFSSELPKKKGEMPAFIRFLGRDHPVLVSDPAEWEQLFSDNDFYILDQRPIHLNMLPHQLTKYIVDLCYTQIKFHGGPLDKIPPRQGPFYFWLIAPRRRRIANGLSQNLTKEIPKLEAPTKSEVVCFEKGETIEVKANLGSKIYQLLSGSADFSYAGLFDMKFDSGKLFGQMEVGRNYFASRLFGSITANEDVLAESFQMGDVASLAHTGGFVGRLFLSMIGHLDSISFTRLLNSKHVSGGEEHFSKALANTPMTSVRNCAAVLLNACAIQCAAQPDAYKGRLLIAITYDKIQEEIYHRALERRDTGLMRVLDLFVKNSIIDCFAGNLLGNDYTHSRLQDDITKIADEDICTTHYLHLGLIAARYIMKAVDRDPSTFDLKLYAIGISALLGSTKDMKALQAEVKEMADTEKKDRKREAQKQPNPNVPQTTRRKAIRIRTSTEKIEFLIKSMQIEMEGELPAYIIPKLEMFFDRLRHEFNFNSKDPYNTRGFSNLIVVRDVWALLGCAMNDDSIWYNNQAPPNSTRYLTQPEQEHRLLAYFYECIGHIAADCGLEV